VYIVGSMKLIIMLLSSFLFALSACGETTHVQYAQNSIVIDSVESNNMIENQLLLEFDSNTSPDQAMQRASACAASVRMIRKKPVLLLVVLAKASDYNIQAQSCLRLQGLLRAEWNQKKRLR